MVRAPQSKDDKFTRLRVGSVAFFVLLAAAAGAWVVAAYVVGGASLGGDGRASGVAGCGQVAFFRALELAFEFVDGGARGGCGDARG
jgi:hypothetical protein